MKIAIISDVHDNIPNLKKILNYCIENKIEKIICCGDLASLETLDFINDNLMKRSIDKYLTVIGYNNGVVGFNNLKFLEEYIESAKKLNDLIKAGVFVNVKNQTMIFAFLLLYLRKDYQSLLR